MLFLRKPKHKDEVIATNKGWCVKNTGEILVSVKDLDKKIKEFKHEFETNILPSIEDIKTPIDTALDNAYLILREDTYVDTTNEETPLETVSEESSLINSEIQDEKPRRGRPFKNK